LVVHYRANRDARSAEWSLYAPGTSVAQINARLAVPLLSGPAQWIAPRRSWDAPTPRQWLEAWLQWRERTASPTEGATADSVTVAPLPPSSLAALSTTDRINVLLHRLDEIARRSVDYGLPLDDDMVEPYADTDEMRQTVRDWLRGG
jgi:hypothetical protein